MSETQASGEAVTPRTRDTTDFHVVGIGASAGELEPLERLFSRLPPDTGMAFVVVQHLSPDFKSLMSELLSRRTRMTVRLAEHEMPVEPNCVYLIPPTKEMTIKQRRLLLHDKDPKHGLALPIDLFLRSLAQDLGERSVAVILSGSGSDAILRLLRDEYGIDFSHYKASTVTRRIERRLALNRSIDLEMYAEQLKNDPRELNSLYEDLLIGVTRFFRDDAAFAVLDSKVIPEIVERTAGDDQIRVWVPGCATGQADARRMLQIRLESTGVRVFTAENWQDGATLIERVRPDLALVDLGLPVMSGYELADWSALNSTVVR